MLGERIAREKLDGEERAEYEKQVIATLAKELTHAYGKGFERGSLLVSKSTAKGGFMSGPFKGPARNKTIGGDYSNGCATNP